MSRLQLSILLFSFLFTTASFGQNARSNDANSNSPSSFDVGLEVQAYPTGVIPGIHLEWGVGSKNGVLARIGYNIVRHRDLGVHEDERGGGFGFSLGYRRYFKENRNGFFLGARTDLWFNDVAWRDDIDLPTEISGDTEVTVLQPTAEAGYVLNLNKGWIFVPSIAFGAEININTEGAPVGEGAIVLLGFTFGKRF